MKARNFWPSWSPAFAKPPTRWMPGTNFGSNGKTGAGWRDEQATRRGKRVGNVTFSRSRLASTSTGRKRLLDNKISIVLRT